MAEIHLNKVDYKVSQSKGNKLQALSKEEHWHHTGN